MTATSIRRAMRRWRADERGSVAVETLLMLPLMTWALLSTLVYFDAFRTEAITQKASLTIADMFSRETDLIDQNYINGANELLKFLTLHDATPELRVTAFYWDENRAAYRVVWSKRAGTTNPGYTNSTLASVADRLPTMANNERAILVETWIDYEAPYDPGLGTALSDFQMETFTVISPRFTSQLCWVNGDAADADANTQRYC